MFHKTDNWTKLQQMFSKSRFITKWAGLSGHNKGSEQNNKRLTWYGVTCIIATVANISPEYGVSGKGEEIPQFPKPPGRILNSSKVK